MRWQRVLRSRGPEDRLIEDRVGADDPGTANKPDPVGCPNISVSVEVDAVGGAPVVDVLSSRKRRDGLSPLPRQDRAAGRIRDVSERGPELTRIRAVRRL